MSVRTLVTLVQYASTYMLVVRADRMRQQTRPQPTGVVKLSMYRAR